MKVRVVVYLVLFELFILSAITIHILQGSNTILGERTYVSPLGKDRYIFPKVDGLQYYYEPKPDLIYTNTLYSRKTNSPYSSVYKINEDGLNQITNVNPAKEKEIVRIMTIGDSFTYGANVNTEDNYPSQLQKLLDSKCTNKFQILNLGVGGYDFQYTVERFKLRGQKYNPDLIIWFIIAGDFLRLNELLIPRLDKIEKGFSDANKNSPATYRKVAEEIIREIGMQNSLDLQESYILGLSKYYEKKIILATFMGTNKRYKEILAKISRLDSNYLLSDEIPNLGYVNSLPDGHPTPTGHKIIAENIFKYLVSEKKIICEN